jgi:hypothetical protein
MSRCKSKATSAATSKMKAIGVIRSEGLMFVTVEGCKYILYQSRWWGWGVLLLVLRAHVVNT